MEGGGVATIGFLDGLDGEFPAKILAGVQFAAFGELLGVVFHREGVPVVEEGRVLHHDVFVGALGTIGQFLVVPDLEEEAVVVIFPAELRAVEIAPGVSECHEASGRQGIASEGEVVPRLVGEPRVDVPDPDAGVFGTGGVIASPGVFGVELVQSVGRVELDEEVFVEGGVHRGGVRREEDGRAAILEVA